MSPEVGHAAVIELSRRERGTRLRFGQAAWAPKPAAAAAGRLFETAARRAAARLSTYLGATFLCAPGETQQARFEQFSDALAAPAFLACLRTDKDSGPAILGFSPELVSSLLAVMLGGDADTWERPAQLTDIERHVLGAVVQIVAGELRQAWDSLTRLSFEPESVTAEPEAGRIRPDALVVVLTASCSLGRQTGRMFLFLPAGLVRTTTRPAGRETGADVLRLARSSQVRAEVRLPGARILARDLLQLKPGQVLRLPHPVDRALSLTVNGKPKFKGQVVTGEHTLGFQIEQIDEGRR